MVCEKCGCGNRVVMVRCDDNNRLSAGSVGIAATGTGRSGAGKLFLNTKSSGQALLTYTEELTYRGEL